MQSLYAVYFDIDSAEETPAHSADQAFEHGMECIGRWLSHLSPESFDASRFRTGNTLKLRERTKGLPRSATWEFIEAADIRVLRVEVTDRDEESGGVFLTRSTLSEEGGRTSLRVSMSRDVPTAWLSPIPPADLRQPGVIRAFVDDERITLRIEQQKQDGQYIQIRSDAEVATLAQVLDDTTRLPILLIHTRTRQAQATARTTATKLIGLVRTVTLNYAALSKLDQLVPASAPPYAGARLLWSDRKMHALTFGASDVNTADTDLLRRLLMQRIAPITALTRGTDHAYRRARQAQANARHEAADARLNDAKTHGDIADQAAELRSAVQELRQENEYLLSLATDFESRADSVPALQAQIEQLKIALATYQQEPLSHPSENPWESLPTLETGSRPSAKALFKELERLTSERLVFTERAEVSWKRAKYPYPDEMRTALIKLANMAIKLYDGSPESMTHLDLWIHENFGLKVAMQDDTIQKNKILRQFHFERQDYDRTPHVKVRDAAPRQEVGRIHFALDSAEGRIIVDHVGVKLY
ncbi:hypothetical protein [Amycolatopsis dendrobii]|uniref:Uncharacterized protein n=1 Tax=Amycolatopsis dendrobii TaxID=2760662 RepID=A0A7W3ZBX7_9PSEU|nr:hypothetical protein [Amycolatopsis dendrobii]MBB1155308.1 hypothetical protein [Amycolatopsis dendrobii]